MIDETVAIGIAALVGAGGVGLLLRYGNDPSPVRVASKFCALQLAAGIVAGGFAGGLGVDMWARSIAVVLSMGAVTAAFIVRRWMVLLHDGRDKDSA